jgi:hypothetical protein
MRGKIILCDKAMPSRALFFFFFLPILVQNHFHGKFLATALPDVHDGLPKMLIYLSVLKSESRIHACRPLAVATSKVLQIGEKAI